MAFVTIAVTRRREGPLGERAKNYGTGETQGVDTADIAYFTPSVCKREGTIDGITNAKLIVNNAGNDPIVLYTTSTVAAITALDTTNLKNVTVRKRRDGNMLRNGTNFNSETQGVNVNSISYFTPSVCKKDGVSDGLTNSEVRVNVGDGELRLWCTENVAEIAALDD